MIKRILIPLDGSEYSETAVEKGIRMASRTGAEIHGLGIIDEPKILHAEARPVGTDEIVERKQKTMLAHAREKVDGFMVSLQKHCKERSVKSKVHIESGDPAQVIIETAHRHDMIVMGQETSFKFMTQEKPCDTMDEVLKASPRPVLIVPKILQEGEGICVATDGSNGASRAVQMYQLMGLSGKRTIKILSVHKDAIIAAKNCEEVEKYFKAHNIKCSMHPAVTDEHPWDYLLNFIEKEMPQVIVMGAHGTSGLKEIFVGSVTKDLIKKSPVPLFIYH